MSSIIRIGWINLLSAMTLTSDLSAESAHPLSNVTSQIKGKVARWDMTGKTALTIKWTSATEYAVNMLLMTGHNFGADTTCRTRIFSGESQTGTTEYDSNNTSGADKIYTEINVGELIVGVDAVGNYYDPDSNLQPVYALPFDTVTGKSGQLDLTIPTPTNNIAQVDKLVLCYGWSPEHSFERNAVIRTESDSEQTVMASGGIRTTKRPARRRMEIDFAYMQDTYRNRLLAIFEKADKHSDLYIIGNPEESGYAKMLSRGVFRGADDVGFQSPFHNGSNMSRTLREN